MSRTKALVSPVVFVPLAILVFIAIGFLTPFLRRTHFIYTSSSDVASSKSSFPLDRKFTLLKSDRTSGEVLLSDIAKQHPGGLIVNFWATWCPPCIEELPSLELLARQLDARKDAGLPVVVAVSVDEKPEDVFHLMKTLDFRSSMMILHDNTGTFARSVGTTRFPETYWLGQDGGVLYKWVGPQNWVAADVIERIALGHKVGKR